MRSMFHASHRRVWSRYCWGSLIRRTGTPRLCAAIIASVCRLSVIRYMITSIFCVSLLYWPTARLAYDSSGGKFNCGSLMYPLGYVAGQRASDVGVVRIGAVFVHRSSNLVMKLWTNDALSVKYADSST